MAAIGYLSEDSGGWAEKPFSAEDPFDNWMNNVRAGPTFDDDPWLINYVGHPYSGSAYYVVARTSGLSAWESFGYSAIMSTFYWEFGLEAFAEQPSIQDLIVTPVLGALLGEQMYLLNERIKQNNNEIYGSRFLGRVALIITNPAGEAENVINSLSNYKYIHDSYLRWKTMPIHLKDREIDYGLGFEFGFRFGR